MRLCSPEAPYVIELERVGPVSSSELPSPLSVALGDTPPKSLAYCGEAQGGSGFAPGPRSKALSLWHKKVL